MSQGNYVAQLSYEEVTKLDHYALESLLKRDPETLEATVRKNQLRCTVGSRKELLSATDRLGAKLAELLNYTTSGLTCGSMKAAVGYTSIYFERNEQLS